ncbi:hypothetical protein VTK73DRAFT_2070 [Phialemonium thermophilum]|uniref:Uncharacterized protein n=1 Tax=Phialemonium thermophilum TaxID=223376 RepID=A0ABR3VSN2_9PEZI
MDDDAAAGVSPPAYEKATSGSADSRSETGLDGPEKGPALSTPSAPLPIAQPMSDRALTLQIPSAHLGLEHAVASSWSPAAEGGAVTTNGAYPALTTHQPASSFSSTAAAPLNYTISPTEQSATMRSRMPDPFFNQSELARQPSDAYDPARRQVHRASELSSLSSGFGDGDIIVPEPAAVPLEPGGGGGSGVRQSAVSAAARSSWLSQSRRDTVYTESSEDSPARFRTVSSWVTQQTSRVKRAQRRAQTEPEPPPVPTMPGQIGIPGIHNPPEEPSFTMMLQDGEVPRRVEDTMALRP